MDLKGGQGGFALAKTDVVVTDDVIRAFTIAGRAPRGVAFPATVDELKDCVTAAHSCGLTIIPAGNGTQLYRGRAPDAYDLAISTRRLNRILAHEAADMTVTVQAGLTLGELNAALA